MSEYCEYWLMNYKEAVSPSMMCRELQKQNLTRKKKTIRSSQSATERVQIYMCEYWEKVKKNRPGQPHFFGGNGRFIGVNTNPCPFKMW